MDYPSGSALRGTHEEEFFGHTLRLKTGADMKHVSQVMAPSLRIAESIYKILGWPFVLTSGYREDDGLHGDGLAWDARTRHIYLYDQQEIRTRLSVALGDCYDVLLEHDPPHLHVERDCR